MISSLLLFAVLALLGAVILLYFEYRSTIKCLQHAEHISSKLIGKYQSTFEGVVDLRAKHHKLEECIISIRHELKS